MNILKIGQISKLDKIQNWTKLWTKLKIGQNSKLVKIQNWTKMWTKLII